MYVELFHEWIGVELFYVPYAWLAPKTFEEHHCTNHGRYARGVANALHARFFVGFLVFAVVVDVVSKFLTVFYATNAASNGCFAIVVGTQVLWVGQHGFQELKGNDVHFYALTRTIG